MLRCLLNKVRNRQKSKAIIKSEVFSEGALHADIGDVCINIEIPDSISFNISAVIADEKWSSRPYKISENEIAIEIYINVLLKVNFQTLVLIQT